MKIGVVGLGRMGSALASALLDKGYGIAVWNRTASRAQPLVERGAVAAQDLSDLLSRSDVVVVNVLDYAASDALLRTPDAEALLAGKILVQFTSGSPAQARDAQAWADRHEVAYLDGAIMATPNYIGAETASLLYAGDKASFMTVAPVLQAFGRAAHVGDDAGVASALDVALLTQMWGRLFGTLQAIAVCKAEAISLDVFADHVSQFAPTVEGAVEDLVARARDGRLRGDEQTLASIAAHYAAYQHLLEIVREGGLDRALPEAMDGLFRRAIDRGHSDDDFAALVPLVAA